MLRVLTLTSLYPNAVQPRHGIFVEERLRQLEATGEIESHVMAPVPWFPFRGSAFGRYAGYARVPAEERRDGRRVRHPRFPSIPRVGMAVAVPLMTAGLRRPVHRLLDEAAIDVIDSHFLFPDGAAALRLGLERGVPVVMTARGSDVNLFTRYRIPRRQILEAAHRCARLVTVSEALRDTLIGLGVPPGRIACLPNGVDLARFRPGDRAAKRAALGLHRPTIISVGNLLELKGHHLLIAALPHLPDVDAIIIGEGPMQADLERQAAVLGVAARVRFTGNLDREDLVDHYQAADGLLLASSREGMPNVVLESLACGTPVIATAVGGVPEVIEGPPAGLLLPERSPDAIVAAIRRLLADPPDRSAVAAEGARHGWEPTVRGLLSVLREAAASAPARRRTRSAHA